MEPEIHVEIDPYWSIGIIVLLIGVSAFFSGAETAITGASKARLHGWEKEGNVRAGQVNKLREKKEHVIGALLFGNTLVNILSSAIATSFLIKLMGESGVVYATIVMTAIILIYAEVLPKTYALHHADKMSVAIVPILRPVIFILSPIAGAINKIVRFTLRMFGADVSKVASGSHLEVLRGVIELHEGDKGEEEETLKQRAMLRSILDLDDVSVGEIMTHRKHVVMIDAEDPVDKIIDHVLNSPYTRLPIYKGDMDNIVGVLHSKALLRELRARGGRSYENLDITSLATAPWFIPDATALIDQLQAFRDRREHFALVIDEYGSFQGIVTLEDILEEIVGDIDDEHDIKVSGVHKQPNGSYMIDGTVTIRDLKREFEWDFPDEDYSTIAGLIIHEAKMIPEPGQSFAFYGFQFDIVKRLRNQLTLIRVTPPAEKE